MRRKVLKKIVKIDRHKEHIAELQGRSSKLKNLVLRNFISLIFRFWKILSFIMSKFNNKVVFRTLHCAYRSRNTITSRQMCDSFVQRTRSQSDSPRSFMKVLISTFFCEGNPTWSIYPNYYDLMYFYRLKFKNHIA